MSTTQELAIARRIREEAIKQFCKEVEELWGFCDYSDWEAWGIIEDA